jgi:hypothetical protein
MPPAGRKGITVEGPVSNEGWPIAVMGSTAAGANPLPVSGTVDTELPAAAALDDATANPVAPMVGAGAMLWDAVAGSWRRVPGDAAGLAVHGRAITTGQLAVIGGANAPATLTITASGAGIFHYITYLHISRSATAALAGAVLLQVTTTNLNMPNVWRTGGNMIAGGYNVLVDKEFFYPLRSITANTNTTIVCPAAGAAVSWTIIAHVYTGT